MTAPDPGPSLPDQFLNGAASALGAGAAAAAITVIKTFGRQLISYYFDESEELSDVNAQAPSLDPNDTSSFAVVGLGRGGSRVTAQLARMIGEARGAALAQTTSSTKTRYSFMNLFRPRPGNRTLRLEPIMVIGDVNEATFAEIDGLLGSDANARPIAEQMMRIDYRPLAKGGCGNVPLFGEFYTRGLLAMPVVSSKQGPSSWQLARNYLLYLCTQKHSHTRIAFYIFAAAGGSGSGAAAEVMRAQRFAIQTRRSEVNTDIYFTGVAVIPDHDSINDQQQINTGRSIIQYLADLNIALPSADAYKSEPRFNYSTRIHSQVPNQPTAAKAAGLPSPGDPLPPWDSLGILSNEVMRIAGGHEKGAYTWTETVANQYIAQQVFNLAAAQSHPGDLKDGGAKPDDIGADAQFKGVHLDTADLKSGLCGPFAYAFSTASREEVTNEIGIDNMILRALALPRLEDPATRRANSVPLVTGLSIAPQDPEKYKKTIESITSRLTVGNAKPGSGPLTRADLEPLREIALFKRCPRLIFVLTSPIDAEVSGYMATRVAQVLTWAFPNLKQPRYAIVKGTTSFFSLSVYIESSVVLCRDVMDAITNYLYKCWKPRSASDHASAKDFPDQLLKLIQGNGPIQIEQARTLLGDRELYGETIPNFDNRARELDTAWRSFIVASKIDDNLKPELMRHCVAHGLLAIEDVTAALNYLNYVAHVDKPSRLEFVDM